MIKKFKFMAIVIFLFFASFSIIACSNPRKVSAGLDHQIKFEAYSGGGGSGGGSKTVATGTAPSIYGYESRWCTVIESSRFDGLNYCIVSDSDNYDTGITLYSNESGNGSSPTSELSVNSNNFYIDFTTANPLYTNEYLYLGVTYNYSYRFEIIQSNTTVWYLESKFDIESNNNYVIEKFDINGKKTTIYLETADYLNFQPTKYGKRSINLADGQYKIKITRNYQWFCAKNSNSPSFYETDGTLTVNLLVDGTSPTLSAKGEKSGNSIANQSYVNEKVKYTASDTNIKGIYYKSPSQSSYSNYSSSSYTTTETIGWWSVYACDKSGNISSTHTFYYDPYKPSGKLISNGNEIQNNSYISSNFIYSAEDNESGIKAIYYKSPITNQYTLYTNGTIITPTSGDGWYSFYSIDYAGNQSDTINVYLESKSPTFRMYRNNELVYSNIQTKNDSIDTEIYFNINDTIRFEYDSSSNAFDSNFAFNTDIIINDTYLDSSYSLFLKSATGIEVNYQFHLIHQKPYITIDNIDYYNDTTLYFKENVIVEFNYDQNVLDHSNTGISISETGGDLMSHYKYAELSQLELNTNAGNETSYTLRLDDRAGNVSNYTIIIDKMVPHGNWISKSNILPNGGYTNSSLKFEYSDDISQALYSVDNSEYKNYNGQTFYTDGNYSILLTDLAGNKHTYTATIDTVAPKGKLYVNSKEAYSGSTVNGTVIFTWDGDSTATCNGEEYIKNTAIENSGVYKFVLKDKAGNEAKYSITIAGELPSITFSLIDNKLNIDIADAINGAGIKSISIYRNGVTVNGTSPDTTNYVFSEHGVYKVIVTDQLNRTIEKRYTFEVQESEPIPEEPSTTPETNTSHEVKVTGANNGEEVNGNVVINEIPAGSTYSLFLNGEQIEYEIGTELEEEGSYQLLVVCEDGTIVNYNFKISSDHSPNGSSIILIIIIVISIIAIIGLAIYRKKGFYKK